MEWTENDYAAFRNCICVAIATVMEGNLAELELTLARFVSDSPTLGDLSIREKLRSQLFTDLLEKNAGLTRELAEAKDALAQAFFAGAKWWNWKQTGATMWQSDQHEVFAAAREQYPYVMFREQILARERDEALAKLKVYQEAVEKMHGSFDEKRGCIVYRG